MNELFKDVEEASAAAPPTLKDALNRLRAAYDKVVVAQEEYVAALRSENDWLREDLKRVETKLAALAPPADLGPQGSPPEPRG